MVNKKAVSIVLILIILIILVIVLVNLPQKITYSKNPQDWVETKISTKTIDVEQVTEGKGYFNTNNQQYKFLSINTAFGYDGIYKGLLFKNQYIDFSNKLLIEITPNLKPNDGVLQGIIVEKFEDGKPVAYIFLDEDWKKQFGDSINIAWGSDYQNFKKFEFNQIATGIYMDKVDDDINRFSEDFNIHEGGIMVGDIQTPGVNMLQIEEDVTVIAIH